MLSKVDQIIFDSLTSFCALYGKKINFTEENFYNYDKLENHFDSLSLSDFETILEDFAFGGRDLIPDGLFKTLTSYKNFIQDEIQKQENKVIL